MCFGSVPMLNPSLLSPLSSYDWRILNPRRAFKPCAEFIFRNKQTRIAFAFSDVYSPHLCFHDPHCVLPGNSQFRRNILACHHSAFPRTSRSVTEHPRNCAMSTSFPICGLVAPASHCATAPCVTPTAFASSSCVFPALIRSVLMLVKFSPPQRE